MHYLYAMFAAYRVKHARRGCGAGRPSGGRPECAFRQGNGHINRAVISSLSRAQKKSGWHLKSPRKAPSRFQVRRPLRRPLRRFPPLRINFCSPLRRAAPLAVIYPPSPFPSLLFPFSLSPPLSLFLHPSTCFDRKRRKRLCRRIT